MSCLQEKHMRSLRRYDYSPFLVAHTYFHVCETLTRSPRRYDYSPFLDRPDDACVKPTNARVTQKRNVVLGKNSLYQWSVGLVPYKDAFLSGLQRWENTTCIFWAGGGYTFPEWWGLQEVSISHCLTSRPATHTCMHTRTKPTHPPHMPPTHPPTLTHSLTYPPTHLPTHNLEKRPFLSFTSLSLR
jgi:hypothetical protein